MSNLPLIVPLVILQNRNRRDVYDSKMYQFRIVNFKIERKYNENITKLLFFLPDIEIVLTFAIEIMLQLF